MNNVGSNLETTNSLHSSDGLEFPEILRRVKSAAEHRVTVDLKGVGLYARSATELNKIFKAIVDTKATSVDLTSNNLGLLDAQLLLRLFNTLGSGPIEHLELGSNQLIAEFDSESVSPILSGLEFSSISHINLNDNKLGLAKNLFFLEFMKNMPLSRIDLRYNDYGYKIGSLGRVLDSLNKKKPLFVDLQSSNFCYSGGDVLFSAFLRRRRKYIRTLNLTSNGLGLVEHQALMQFIKELKRYKTKNLYLSDNRLSKKTGDELCELAAAIKRTQLTYISLSGNQLYECDADELRRFLLALNDSNVCAISLECNELSKKTSEELYYIFPAIGKKRR